MPLYALAATYSLYNNEKKHYTGWVQSRASIANSADDARHEFVCDILKKHSELRYKDVTTAASLIPDDWLTQYLSSLETAPSPDPEIISTTKECLDGSGS